MPDFRELVELRLAGLKLSSSGKREVIEELASHLEEESAGYQRRGFSAEAARQKSLQQVSDWDALALRIYAAKEGKSMNTRTRTIWIPGVLSLSLTMGLLLLLQFAGFQPRALQWGGNGLVLFYLPWLCALPLFGAFGAFLSRRAGGSRNATLLASVFPAIYFAICFLVILPLAVVFNSKVASHFQPWSLFPQLFAWLILPIAALLLGGLAFLATTKKQDLRPSGI
jgi:hypothetical protein